MVNPDFPPNSEASKLGRTDDKNITRVTSGDAVRRKRSLRKQFLGTFIAGTPKAAFSYVLMDVLLPAAQDMVAEAFGQFGEKLFRGASRRHSSGGSTPYSGPTGFVQYNRQTTASRLTGPQRAMSRQARAQHNFDEIVLESRAEAEAVIDRLFDLVRQYDTASVADLYELVGFPSAHTDHKWGWTNLSGAGVSRVRGGYLLDLPDPHPLD